MMKIEAESSLQTSTDFIAENASEKQGPANSSVWPESWDCKFLKYPHGAKNSWQQKNRSSKLMETSEHSPNATNSHSKQTKQEMISITRKLPIHSIREEMKNILCNEARVLLIIAETGCGKSTCIPQFLALDDIVASSHQILCTQPRKTALCEVAKSVAEYLTNCCSVNTYNDRLSGKTNGKIIFATEKNLLDIVQLDDTLSSFGCVMIDEVHERTMSTDMCLGMMKKVLRLRLDMKLVICSATMDADPLLNYFSEFQARKLEVSGRRFPIQILYEPPSPSESLRISCLMRDYVGRTVQKVIDICDAEAKKQPFQNVGNVSEMHAGHILAFLPTPFELLMAEERLYRELKERKHPVRVKILNLYGHMSTEDRAEVFARLEPEYHHMVIFTTNVGETAITVSGARYVVDCGLAKVKKYNSVRRTNTLEIGLISRSAAMQRAGRVGRTGPGICYRLYSEMLYESMEPAKPSEILQTNLAEVVLYMVATGIENPAGFDFLDKPEEYRLLQAEILLRSLKALTTVEQKPVLTETGVEMRLLPIEPRLAKMVLDSVYYDLVAEAAVVCAGIHVGSPFRRRRNDKFLFMDQKKLSFCQESGDPMTLLTVFEQYLKTPKSQRKNWCFQNYIDLKSMKSVVDMACKICRIISGLKSVQANISTLDLSKARAHIPYLFCQSFGNNLACYSGLPHCGYYDVGEPNKCVFIHPSSALSYSDVIPEFIVYECSVQSSKDFVTNVCAADPSWLDNLDQNVLAQERKRKLVPYNVTCGTEIKKWLMTQIDRFQQEFGSKCFVYKREKNSFYQLQIYVSANDLPKLEAFVNKFLQAKIDEKCKKTMELPVVDADYLLHIAGDGTPLEILMPGEFCSMFVGNEGIDWAKSDLFRDKLKNYFSQFGKITDFTTFGEELQKKFGHSCLIRMENKTAALNAFVYNNEKECGLNIEPRFGTKYLGVVNRHPCAYRLLIGWWRRPSLRIGHIKLKCRNFVERMSAFEAIARHLHFFLPSMLPENIMERDRNVAIEDLFKIKLKNLPLNMDNRELHRIVKPILDAHGIEFDGLYILRKKTYPIETEEMMEQLSQKITDYIIKVARDENVVKIPLFDYNERKERKYNGYPFDVKIISPKYDSDQKFVAHVIFYDMNIGKRISDALRKAAGNGIVLEMGPENQTHPARFNFLLQLFSNIVKANYGLNNCSYILKILVEMQPMYQYQVKIWKPIFEAVFSDLKKIYNKINAENIYFDYRTNNQNYRLLIAGKNFNAVNELKASVEEVINGFTLLCRNNEEINGMKLPCHRLLTKVGRGFLQDLSEQLGVLICVSSHKTEVKIRGSVANVFKAKLEVARFLREWSDADINQLLILQPPNYKAGTMKALLAQNDYDILSLEKQLGHGAHLDANISRRELFFAGKETEYRHLLDLLRAISDSLPLKDSDIKENERPECAICLTAVELKNYSLQACGHYACKSCLDLQLKTAFETRGFPIVCVACQKPFTWSDLEFLLFESSDRDKNQVKQLQSLADASIAYFIQRNGNLYMHCRTPDCRGLHPVTKGASLSRCKLCDHLQCTKCGREDHESMTCEGYAKCRTNADESLKKWLQDDQNQRRICPNPGCRSGIEKFGGCNHMQCAHCKIHFCWICMFSADESSTIYSHMSAEHGGSGADINELIAEIQNDPLNAGFFDRDEMERLLNPGNRFEAEEEALWLMPGVMENEVPRFLPHFQFIGLRNVFNDGFEFRNDHFPMDDNANFI
ncbi:unnamed protein product [Thelazia callipaeda]|uniref:RNA helicase n=1 Tax=Thelazia callipaeda TaxID=103827 RepID=A0A0N5D8A0_THECL|nr:unnamed protein product [Thelazia callipaeda]